MPANRSPSRLALAAVSAATAAGYSRLFSDAGWMLPVAVAVIGAHGLEVATRRWSWPQAALAHLAALAVFLALTLTYSGGAVPTSDAFTRLGEVVLGAAGAMRSAVVPAPTTPELLLWAVAGIWGCAALADGLAHRRRAGLAAVVPLILVYTLVAALGTARLRPAISFAFVATVCLFAAVERAQGLPARRALTAGARGQWSRPALAGVASACLVAAMAVVLAPVVPGGASPPILDLRALGEGFDLSRVEVNPLVDVKPYLSSPPVVQLFTVRSPVPAYWRLAALDRFDGRLWSPLRSAPLAGRTGEAEEGTGTELRQEFRLDTLDSAWLPAAYRAERVEAPGAKLDPETHAVVSRRGARFVRSYAVESRLAGYGPGDLARVPASLDHRLDLERQLPVDFPASVRALARQVVSGAHGPYEQAIALQRYLRNGYAYSTAVPAGHSSAHLENFLFRSRAGYCEQFAAAFAAMARSLGMPARVAVGFTPGTYEPDTGVWRVTTKEAHAWPEVYFTGFGWAAFEPTPGRFEPSLGNHTGTYRPSEVRPAPAAAGTGSRVPSPPALSVTPPRGGSEGDAGPPKGDLKTGERRWLRLLGLLLAPSLLLAVPPLIKAGRRRHRRAGRAGERVAAAWWEALDRLAEAGLRPRAPETPLEFARRASRVRPAAGPALGRLALLVNRSAYAMGVPADADGASAWAATVQLTRALNAGEPRWVGWVRSMDPRSLRRSRAG